MIGDKFDFNGKQYEIKNDVSFGEYKKITRLQLDMKNATTDNENELVVKFNETMTEFLETKLGISEQEIDRLGLVQSAELFGQAFLVSTSIKKNSEKTSD